MFSLKMLKYFSPSTGRRRFFIIPRWQFFFGVSFEENEFIKQIILVDEILR
jgi:hypothetical protein